MRLAVCSLPRSEPRSEPTFYQRAAATVVEAAERTELEREREVSTESRERRRCRAGRGVAHQSGDGGVNKTV